MSRVSAEINLGQLTKNYLNIKNNISEKTKIMGVVKADGYGHGVMEVAKSLIDAGVDYLGVAAINEAVELRAEFKEIPIIILSEPDSRDAAAISKYNLVQTIYTYDFAEMLSKKNKDFVCSVHIKVDTGMTRVGLAPANIETFIEKIKKLENIKREGLFTHFACADEPDNKLNKIQIEIFNQTVEKTRPLLPDLKYVHAANSAAIFNFKEAHYDMVRVGIALYKNVMTFKSRVAYVKTVAANIAVSYGATYVTDKETKIATVSAGYADGYNRLLSNRGHVLINGKEYPIIGRICMDMFMVDVTGSDVKVGDEAVLIGKSGDKMITATDVAGLIDTIDYEVLCNISKRVPRVYI